MTYLPAEFPDFGLTLAQRREAVRSHYYEWPGMDGERGEIWCYTDRFSYRAGERVFVQVSSTASAFAIEVTRDGGEERTMLERGGLAARWQDTPDQCSAEGCGWESAFEFRIGEDWPCGAYRVTLTAQGRDGTPIRCHHLFIIAPRPGRKPGRILQVAATGTWLAYNTWGGSNHYEGITGPNRDQYSPAVSTQRPWCRGFVVLPRDAPRVPLEVAMPPKTVPRYPHMEWAFATGHSKKYASAGWASYDSHFFRFAERAGYEIDLASQHELHFSPEILEGYDCVVFVGHDEYWTWEMRDAVDAYVERGGHAARFAGNFMWQTRLEDEGRRQVCYKYRARAEDPVYASGDVTRATTSWEVAEIGRPGAATFGLNATRGLYAGWGGCAPRGARGFPVSPPEHPGFTATHLFPAGWGGCAPRAPRGFPVYRPEHWAFAGTGLYYGDVLGAQGHVFGYEVDGLEYEIRGGLPYAIDKDTPDGLEILGLGMASQVEESADIAAEDQFLSDEDGRFSAEILLGEASDANLDRIKRSNGMIVNFPRGKGEVFHAGSCEWVAGLLRGDAMVEQVTKNVLNRYLGK